MSYKMEQWVRDAIAELPFKERVQTRIKLNRALKEASKYDEEICRIMNTMDCGYELADYITGGKIARAEKQRDIYLKQADTIIKELKEKTQCEHSSS